MTMSVVIYLKKNSYLVNAINDKIGSLRAAGLIDYWYSLSFTNNLNRKHAKPRKVLSWDHLSGCFEIWAGGCLISSLTFVTEFIVKKFKMRKSEKRTLKWQRK